MDSDYVKKCKEACGLSFQLDALFTKLAEIEINYKDLCNTCGRVDGRFDKIFSIREESIRMIKYDIERLMDIVNKLEEMNE